MSAAKGHKQVQLSSINGDEIEHDEQLFLIDLGRYEKFMRHIDYQQACARFEWLGLPENIYGWNIERMLYFKHSLAFFKQGGVFYCLPYTNEGDINAWGMPSKIRPISFTGAGDAKGQAFVEQSLPVNSGGAYVGATGEIGKKDYKPGQAILIFDRPPENIATDLNTSRFAMNYVINNDLALRLAYLKINLMNANKKLTIMVDNIKQKEAAEKEAGRILNPLLPYRVVVRGAASQLKTDTVDAAIEYMEQGIWEDFSSLNNLRLYSLGIENNGTFQKKERQITAEQAGGSEQTNLILQMGLETRKLAVEYIKKAFPDELKDLQVKLRDVFVKTAPGADAAVSADQDDLNGGENAI